MASAWEENTTKTNRVSGHILLTTGVTEEVKKKNIYDIAGNLWEIVKETAGSVVYTSFRGGSFDHAFASYPACYRNYATLTDTYTRHGFRPVLYIK